MGKRFCSLIYVYIFKAGKKYNFVYNLINGKQILRNLRGKTNKKKILKKKKKNRTGERTSKKKKKLYKIGINVKINLKNLMVKTN